MSSTSEPAWHPDPTGIHHFRYWDGESWTSRVADRFGATSAHHLQQHYPPPVSEPSVAASAPPEPRAVPDEFDAAPADVVAEPLVEPAADLYDFGLALPAEHRPSSSRSSRSTKRKRRGRRSPFRRVRSDDAQASAIEEPRWVDEHHASDTAMDAILADVPTEASGSDDEAADALMLGAHVLQRACEDAGFDWRESDMTIDEAINALPVDIAENTVNIMHRLFATAGDRENANWTDTKLREIQTLRRGYRRLQHLVSATPRDELMAKSRSFGVADDVTEDFIDGLLGSTVPTVAELQTADLPVADPDVGYESQMT